VAVRTQYLPSEMNATECSKALGVSTGLIAQWVSDGILAPFTKRGPSPIYRLSALLMAADIKGRDLSDILPNVPEAVRREMREAAGDVDESAPDYQAARARREVANASIAELNLAARRGEMLPAGLVRSVFGSVGAVIRERALSIITNAQSFTDDIGLGLLTEEVHAALVEMERNAERLSAQLYEGAEAVAEDE